MLERRKEGMVNAFWANDGMNDDKGTRENAILELEERFDVTVRAILFGSKEEEEIDKNNPFFEAMEKGMQKLELPVGFDDETMKAVVEQEQDFDQYIDQS